MQRLDHASAAALKRGDVLRAVYKDGFTHRLLLERPLPAMPSCWQTPDAVFCHLTRYPVDVYVTVSVADSERVLAQQAKQHGDWTLQHQQAGEGR
jgi:hypothetical protein